ncbi:MAG: hypothetical protein M0026_20530 [Nocardiopsaceae bacterium]|nr:hypothetical protein [Nocardiopsaceae bacterium]
MPPHHAPNPRGGRPRSNKRFWLGCGLGCLAVALIVGAVVLVGAYMFLDAASCHIDWDDPESVERARDQGCFDE